MIDKMQRKITMVGFTLFVLAFLQCAHAQNVNNRHYLIDTIMDHVIKHQEFMKQQNFTTSFGEIQQIFANTAFPPADCVKRFSPSIPCLMALVASQPYLNKYLDSLAKPPTGLFQGNVKWLGNYDECMSIPNAHYCDMKNVAVMNHMFSLSTYGVCAPEKCSIYDITNLLNATALCLKSALNTTMDIISVAPVDAYIPPNPLNPVPAISKCLPRNNPYTTGATVMIVISSLILALCFIGTITDLGYTFYKNLKSYNIKYDDLSATNITSGMKDNTTNESTNVSKFNFATETKSNKFISFLLCFSISKNTKTLFDTKVPNGAITAINGIRTISITWVILGHLMGQAINSDNPTVVLSVWSKRFSMQAIVNAFVSVDTFFVLSGVLVGYLSFKRFEVHGKLPLLRFYIHRYIRLTPSYAFLIFFVTYLFPYFGDGPSWINETDQNCKDSWWTNLLYINNIYPSDSSKECYGVSWYLANDMQFYVISPLILWVMYRFKLVGVLVATSVFLLEFFLANGILIDEKNATPVLLSKNGFLHTSRFSFTPYTKYIYFKPWTRIGPYVIGIVLGYILFYKKTIKMRFSMLVYLLGWIVAIGLGMAVVYGPYTAINDHVWGAVETISYGISFRIVWSIAICWVIYACHNGYGSLINDFLSWKAFIPLSRLTYGVYLIHIYVIQLYFSSSKTVFHTSEVNIAFVFIPIIFISYCLSYIVAVCIEYPVFNLEKLFLKF